MARNVSSHYKTSRINGDSLLTIRDSTIRDKEPI